MSDRFSVQLNPDQFDKLARPTQPVRAVAELLWNSLDAEADKAEVILARTELEAIDSVFVRDNGHGMTQADAKRDFVQLGGSWKKHQLSSKHGRRSLHGKLGEGRFRAFAIGELVEWDTVAETGSGELERVVVTGALQDGQFEVGDPAPAAGAEPGTTVRIKRPREHAQRLVASASRTRLTVQFALFLLRSRDVTIIYDDERLDPETLIDNRTAFPLDEELGGGHAAPIVEIIEWNEDGAGIERSMLLCSANGGVLHAVTDRLPSIADFPYTAYVRWDGFQEHSQLLGMEDGLGHAALGAVIDAARDAIQVRLDEISAARRTTLVDQWKRDDIYPFEGSAADEAEHRTRTLFDLVAVTAAPAVSEKRREAKLTLRLLREALEDSPAALHRVLREVLDLTPAQIDDFDHLLNQTPLTAVIQTTKVVTDRLVFLDDLQAMVFDDEKCRRLLERTELHKVLEKRSWIFGEDYEVAVSDKGLTKVLHAHRDLIDSGEADNAPVQGEDGGVRIVDLFLSRVAETHEGRRHLVVELKRPSIMLSLTQVNQIDEYALTIMDEPRFKAEGVVWDFWLIGNDMAGKVRIKAQQRHRLPGIVSEGHNYRVWVRTWSDLLEENRRRLHFYRARLNYRAPEDADLDTMRSKYIGTNTAVE